MDLSFKINHRRDDSKHGQYFRPRCIWWSDHQELFWESDNIGMSIFWRQPSIWHYYPWSSISLQNRACPQIISNSWIDLVTASLNPVVPINFMLLTSRYGMDHLFPPNPPWFVTEIFRNQRLPTSLVIELTTHFHKMEANRSTLSMEARSGKNPNTFLGDLFGTFIPVPGFPQLVCSPSKHL